MPHFHNKTGTNPFASNKLSDHTRNPHPNPIEMVNFEQVLRERQKELSHWLGSNAFIDYAGMKVLIDKRSSESERRDLATTNGDLAETVGEGTEANAAAAQNSMVEHPCQGTSSAAFFQAWDMELQKVKTAIEQSLHGKHYCSVPCGPLRLSLNSELMSRELADALFQAIELNREGFRKIIKKWDKHSNEPSAQAARLATFDLVMAGTMNQIEYHAIFNNKAAKTKSQKSKVFALFLLVSVIATVVLVSIQATTVQVAFVTGLIAAFLTAWGNAANDICNAVGTAVGCKALTLGQAVMWGAVFEVFGALTMGPYVSKSITRGIIITDDYAATPELYAFGMVCVLFGTGSTTLLATFYGFPISATHGMIGGLVAIGMATHGVDSIGWKSITKTCIGWVAAPLVGCMVAALVFVLIGTFMVPGRNPALWSARLQPAFLWLCLTVNIVFIFIKGPKKVQIKPVGKAVLIAAAIGLALVVLAFSLLEAKRRVLARRKARGEGEHAAGEVGMDDLEAANEPAAGAGVGEESWLAQREGAVGNSEEEGGDRAGGAEKEGAAEERTREGAAHSRAARAMERLAGVVHLPPHRQHPEPPQHELRFTFRDYKGGKCLSSEAEQAMEWTVRHADNSAPSASAPDAVAVAVEDASPSPAGALRPEAQDAGKADLADAEARFVPLLIVSALSVACAHGGNDIGNAVGPLAAILQVVATREVSANPDVPMWALVFGSAGFLIGIATMGRLTIQTVGTKITELTPSKSFATQMGGAIAVLGSSALGLPVSTSHCLVGAVVGVGMVQTCTQTGSVNLAVLGRIALAWVVTIPLAMLVSVVVYLPFKDNFV